MRDNVGEIPCPFGGGAAYIRKAKGGRYPYYLWAPHLGPVFLKTEFGQDYLLSHGTLYAAGEPVAEGVEVLEAEPVPDAAEETGVTKARSEAEKRASWWDEL